MSISVTCACGRRLKAPDAAAGKQAKCPACGTMLLVPAAEPENEPSGTPSSRGEDDSPANGYEVEDTPAPPPRKSAERSRPIQRPSAPTYTADRYKDILQEKPARPMRDYAYFVLLLALLPLLFTLTIGQQDPIGERMMRTIERAPDIAKARIIHVLGSLEEGKGSMDDLFSALPDGKIEGAHLARQTFVHYGYAALAAIGFFGLSFFLAPANDAKPIRILLVGLFTGTIGIVFLFLVQAFAEWTQGGIFISRNLVILVAYWIAFAIGFSYRAALDPESNFLVSFLGYTFGVGLCEEVCKAIPLIVYYKDAERPDWRVACSWGFASGVGFGVAEAVMYSGRHFNGFAPGHVYLTRFVSCVALHAIWSVSVALFIHAHRSMLEGPLAWHDYIPRVIFFVSVPMVLHGLYDTALKKEWNLLALGTALASFGWLAWCIERARATDGAVQKRRA
jgi:RsiW-degrading membrane proteinase PrsW (M82 family)